MIASPTPSSTGRYYRHLEGADFSLEANTEAVPESGHFYVLRAGEVLLKSKAFANAEAAYKVLCHEFWETRLGSEDPSARIASAWGLLGGNPGHRKATAVIEKEGTAADCRRMLANANRQRAMEQRNLRTTGVRSR